MVKRYFCIDSDGESCGLLHEHPDGVCVEYLDYQKLEAENVRLRAAFNGDVGSLADCNEINKELVETLKEITQLSPFNYTLQSASMIAKRALIKIGIKAKIWGEQ